MRARLAFVAFVAFACAGCFVPAVDATSGVHRGSKAEVAPSLQRLLRENGDRCEVDVEHDIRCESREPGGLTFAIVQAANDHGPYLRFVSSFFWRQEGRCQDVAERVNVMNEIDPTVHFICFDKILAIVATMSVPERGFTDAEMSHFLAFWKRAAARRFDESELRPRTL